MQNKIIIQLQILVIQPTNQMSFASNSLASLGYNTTFQLMISDNLNNQELPKAIDQFINEISRNNPDEQVIRAQIIQRELNLSFPKRTFISMFTNAVHHEVIVILTNSYFRFSFSDEGILIERSEDREFYKFFKKKYNTVSTSADYFAKLKLQDLYCLADLFNRKYSLLWHNCKDLSKKILQKLIQKQEEIRSRGEMSVWQKLGIMGLIIFGLYLYGRVENNRKLR